MYPSWPGTQTMLASNLQQLSCFSLLVLGLKVYTTYMALSNLCFKF